MKRIDGIVIEVFPERWLPVPEAVEVTAYVKVSGRDAVSIQKVLLIDDFTTVFDLLWDDIGRLLKSYITNPTTVKE